MTALHFNDWLSELRKLFPQQEEYELAAAIYSFHSAWVDGLTPQQAYENFDAWTQEDAA
jgi:hypothetical protein